MRLRMNAEREEKLKRLKEATGENTKSGAIDVAMAHYLTDKRNKEAIADELSTAHAEKLSTEWLPIRRETEVGREQS